MTLRSATPYDVETISRTHVACWHETYTGLLPQEEIDARSLSYRQRIWRTQVGRAGTRIMLAGEAGFAQVGPQRDTAARLEGYEEELYALYLRQAHHGTGLGRALLIATLGPAPRPFTALVLQGNARATAFYAKTGGRLIGERPDRMGDTVVIDLMFGWNAAQLTALCAAA